MFNHHSSVRLSNSLMLYCQVVVFNFFFFFLHYDRAEIILRFSELELHLAIICDIYKAQTHYILIKSDLLSKVFNVII